MIRIRKSEARGRADHGWLDTRHTFSFADYRDPNHDGFRTLRVLNEDRVAGGAGFGTHAHRDMEIVSYIVSGELAHRDDLGNGSTLKPGDVQRMSAGTGVRHSEKNPSPTEASHFLQIWIVPERRGLEPGYEEATFTATDKRGRLRLLASGSPRDGALEIHQDVDLYGSVLGRGESVRHALGEDRAAWVQIVHGHVTADGHALRAGDGAAVTGVSSIDIDAHEESEFLLFDLA